MVTWPLLVLGGLLALAGCVAVLLGQVNVVYWWWGADRTRPLYIGVTDDIRRRTGQHQRESVWWPQVVGSPTVRRYRSRAVAERAEEVAIHRDRPYFNDRHNRDNPRRVVMYRPRRVRVRG